MPIIKTSRRNFVLAAGSSTLVLPVFEAFTPEKAQAQMMGEATQLVVYYTANGTPLQENFFPRGGTETDFQLGPVLSPLEPHKQDLLLVENLDSQAAIDTAADPHGTGFSTMLSGRKALPASDKYEFRHGACFNDPNCSKSGLGGGPSMDQVIAQDHLAKGLVPEGSLNYSVKTPENYDLYTYMSYRGNEDPIVPESDPMQAFSRVFTNLGMESTLTPEQQMRLLQRNQSVLDELNGEFSQLVTKISAADKQRLEQHQTAIRNLETKLGALENLDTGSACQGMDAPPDLGPGPLVARNAGGMEDKDASGDHDTIEERQNIYREMIVTGLACGVTRVGTLMTSFSRADTFLLFLDYNGQPIDVAHHAMSHNEGDNPNDKLIVVNNWYAKKFGEFVQLMKDTIGPSGKSLFETSGMFWCNELALGPSHSHTNKPHLVAGNMNGYLKNGLHYTYPAGTPHNVLLTALAQGAGVETEHVGDADYAGHDLTPLLA